MKRPDKREYNFNDIYDCILLSIKMNDYADYLENKLNEESKEHYVAISKVPKYLKDLIDFTNRNSKHCIVTDDYIYKTLYMEKEIEKLKDKKHETRKSN